MVDFGTNQPAVRNCQWNGDAPGISKILESHRNLFGRQRLLRAKVLDDELIGLMKNEVIHIVGRTWAAARVSSISAGTRFMVKLNTCAPFMATQCFRGSGLARSRNPPASIMISIAASVRMQSKMPAFGI